MARISGEELIALRDVVVECFTAADWKELGVLTGTIDQVERHDRLLRSLAWGDPDYKGHALEFLRRMIGPDEVNLGRVQNYIYQNCDRAGDCISSAGVGGGNRRIVFAPGIFIVPTEGVNENLVSAMMPFGHEFSPVLAAIRDAAIESGFECKRADDIWNHSTIIQDVFSLIFKSYIVVCDFSGKNPNVFYEAGIAHTLGKHVVPITRNDSDIPFDLQHHRHIRYLPNGEGLAELRSRLKDRFATLGRKRSNPWL